MRIAKLTIALLGLTLAVPALAEDFKVVANLEVPVENLSRAQLSDIFLKRASNFPGDGKAVPADLGEGNKAFDSFCQAIHGKPGSLIRAFWNRLKASGRDTPPIVRNSDDEMLAFIRSTRGAIGYVSAGANTAGVKVLRVGGN